MSRLTQTTTKRQTDRRHHHSDAPCAPTPRPTQGAASTRRPAATSLPRRPKRPSTAHPMHSGSADVSVMRNRFRFDTVDSCRGRSLGGVLSAAPRSRMQAGRRPVWCSSRCRNIAAVTRRGAREAAVQIRMIDVPKAPKPRPERTPTQEERDQSAISRVARSSRLSRDLLVRLRSRRQRGELDSEVWDDVTAMLDQFVPGYSPRLAPPAPRPMSGSALERLGNAWVRRTSR